MHHPHVYSLLSVLRTSELHSLTLEANFRKQCGLQSRCELSVLTRSVFQVSNVSILWPTYDCCDVYAQPIMQTPEVLLLGKVLSPTLGGGT